MSVSDGFLDYVTEQLERVTKLSTRRMFGAVGLYDDDVFFGIVDDDELYLKVDDENRPSFEKRGMAPFRPYGDERSMNYYQAPADVIEDEDLLREWVAGAVAAGRRRELSKKRSRRA